MAQMVAITEEDYVFLCEQAQKGTPRALLETIEACPILTNLLWTDMDIWNALEDMGIKKPEDIVLTKVMASVNREILTGALSWEIAIVNAGIEGLVRKIAGQMELDKEGD